MFRIGDETVALVTESSCDLSDEQLRQYDIRLLPLRLATSQGEKRDRIEITQGELYELLKTELPKTSLPLPEDAEALYKSLQSEGCTRVLHISMSSGLSGTCQMLRMIAGDFDAMRIDIIDSLTLSAGLGLLVLQAGEMLSEGNPPEAVIDAVQRSRKAQLGSFLIRTLEYLRKGGRIGLVEGVVGSLLNIKPVIFVNDDGVYQTLTKARGFQNARKAMEEEFVRRYSGVAVRLAVVHGNAEEEGRQLLETMKSRLRVVSSCLAPVSPALAVHTGPGLLGIICQPA